MGGLRDEKSDKSLHRPHKSVNFDQNSQNLNQFGLLPIDNGQRSG